MAVAPLGNSESRLDFFQQRIVHAVEHWASHDAVQNVEVKVLDLKREAILRAIALGLEFEPAWPIVKRLVIAFTPYMERRGYWDAWNGILEQAIGVAQNVDDVETETTLTALLARLCQGMSKSDDVVRHYRQVIRLARRTTNEYELARACSNLGYLYIDAGRWWRSEVLSYTALEIFDKLDSNHGRAHTHNHLGVLFSRTKQFGLAEQHLHDACDAWMELDDKHGLVRGFLNQSSLFLDMERPDEAQRILHKALRLSEETGDRAEIGIVRNNMGLAYILSHQYKLALENLIASKEIFITFRNPRMLSKVYQNIGRVNLHQNKWEDALAMLELALQTIRTTSDREAEIAIQFTLAEYAIQRGDSELAFTLLREIRKFTSLYTSNTLNTYFAEQIANLSDRIAKL